MLLFVVPMRDVLFISRAHSDPLRLLNITLGAEGPEELKFISREQLKPSFTCSVN
jgi:hypothetical protein